MVASGPGAAGVPPGVRVVPHLVREVSPFRDLRAFLEILRLLREVEPEVLHTHTSKAGFLGRWAAWCRNLAGGRLKTVHTPHGPVFRGYFGPWMSLAALWAERAAARGTDRFTAVSPAEARENLARGVGRQGQWSVVSGGLEVRPAGKGDRDAARRELNFGPDDFVVGTAARLEPVKGVRHLIEAAGVLALNRPGLRLVVFGDGGERSELEKLAVRLGLGRRIFFAGWRDDVPKLLPGLDAYVQPSLAEGFGWAALEAQAAGLPVIASAAGGLGDIVKHEETGLLVPPADPAALAAALSRLLTDPALGKRLAAAGAEAAAAKEYGPQAAAEELEKIYGELALR